MRPLSGDLSIVSYEYRVQCRADGWYEVRAFYLDFNGDAVRCDSEALLVSRSLELLKSHVGKLALAVETYTDSDSCA